jgi:hypothetical protein
LQVEHPVTKVIHTFSFSKPKVGKPIKEDVAIGADTTLLPRECRESVSKRRLLCFYKADVPAATDLATDRIIPDEISVSK